MKKEIDEIISDLANTLAGNALDKHSALERMEEDAEGQFEEHDLTPREKEIILDEAAEIIVKQLRK